MRVELTIVFTFIGIAIGLLMGIYVGVEDGRYVGKTEMYKELCKNQCASENFVSFTSDRSNMNNWKCFCSSDAKQIEVVAAK